MVQCAVRGGASRSRSLRSQSMGNIRQFRMMHPIHHYSAGSLVVRNNKNTYSHLNSWALRPRWLSSTSTTAAAAAADNKSTTTANSSTTKSFSSELDLNLTPSQVVAGLDRHIVGQHDAKRAVAIAMRNRWRRKQLSEELRKEVTPRNVLLVGPTGCGKTEGALFLCLYFCMCVCTM